MAAKVFRILAPALLVLHCGLHFLGIEPTIYSELFLYNAVPLVSILLIASTKRINDRLSKPLFLVALTLWFSGSLISSISTFFTVSLPTQNLANTAYLLFYPCAIIAIPRVLTPTRKFTILELFDASIVGLGLSVLGATFALKPVLPHFNGNMVEAFFALAFPMSDLILISLTFTTILSTGYSPRSLALMLGISIFTITDFFFLWQHINGTYAFGSLIDDGWLLGIVLIAESFSHHGGDNKNLNSVNPLLIALTVFMSATLLALIAIRPGYFPTFSLIPAIMTLALAFIRMTIALKQASHIGQERALARTDELTGLPNRRRLISEIESFVIKDGSLLLLDLDDFKPVNDLHGHQIGDRVLQQVSTRFSRALPHNALLARLGGDEFGVLLEGSYENAMETALALRATLSYPFIIENQHIQIGVSIGVAANNGSADLLRRADDAMYRAKREGLGVYQL